uniref:Uncharacterized protein n=1 Tax=Kalanchoe fedtschenkoi TaxID=63787 RepID=A0A7N0V315_KALFE
MLNTTKTTVEMITHKEANEALSSDKAMATASRIQAQMSFTSAEDMAILPSSVLSSFSSARIRARTGKAVTASATLTKRMYVPWLLTSSGLWSVKPKITPMTKGKIMPPTAMASAFLPERRITPMSISTPTRKRK